MPKFPKPWFRRDRNAWYVQLNGKQIKLSSDRATAFACYHELMKAPHRPSVAPTDVMALIDQFLEWTRQHRATRTFEWYLERCQKFVDTLPPNLAAQDVRPYHVQAWVDAHPQWSSGMKRGCIIAIQRTFNWAEKQGLIERSPIRGIEKPAAGKRTEVITLAQYRQLLEHVQNPRFADLLVAAWETGARPQELTRVEQRHFDEVHSRWVFPPGEAKVKSRPRIIYLPPSIVEMTLRLAAEFPDGPLFRNTRGRPWNAYALNCAFQRLQPKIGRKVCLYMFRHSFATRKLEAGVDPLTLAILLGHANPAMLSTTYQHLSLNPSHLLSQLQRGALTASDA